MKILIIEDEVKLGKYLKQGLDESGFNVDLVDNGIDGLHQTTEMDYDLVLLDVMLPGMNGWDILKRLRLKPKYLPVIMLTARDDVADRVQGLELGADDYMSKPFSFCELLARIHNQLRDKGSTHSAILTIGDLEFNRLKRKVKRDGDSIDLTAKEFALLEFLLTRQGQVLSKSQIASHVWDINFDSDTNIIEVAIKRLRNKIDQGFSSPLIHTVRGMGYVLELRS
ncbi:MULTISPECIES: heavy metal response regulator transcription factor [Moritella]|uniref:DNA-binding response regulator in two-component regulatory system with CusS n=1 Tax=Moritella yayanosii TaxID=69539 RepID=A0A330LNF1_9GAMM|nr:MULTISPECIES: heavy metal response regulator transcription factor [Moritella]EDM66680.1 Heavy metal response regulator [Moritella sp. PE36]SQD78223.1 DNA-binding response regulator in two-component regulatory system with CusS [Moritella yayanosii]